MPNTIQSIKAREILDSRGNPTVEVTMSNGEHVVKCAVPSGASRGSYEAIELRDQDPDRFAGLGVLRAVNNVNDIIAPALRGAKPDSQQSIDNVLRELDGTNNKSNLGANALLGVSIANAKLAAKLAHQELHEHIADLCHNGSDQKQGTLKLFANMINGGAHATGSTSVQEFQIIPMHDTLTENIRLIRRFQTKLGEKIANLGYGAVGIGDEGGYTLPNHTTAQVLDLLHNIKAEMKVGSRLAFGLDVAANELFDNNRHYNIDGQHLKPILYQDVITDLAKTYSIFAIEDPFEEHEFDAFAKLRIQQPETLIIGDDLTVTNTKQLQKAMLHKSIDGLIIKPNQIGTLTETLDVITLAHQNNIKCIASHRSGETSDDFIADIAIGAGCFGAKLGALQRGERTAKYNRLLEISE